MLVDENIDTARKLILTTIKSSNGLQQEIALEQSINSSSTGSTITNEDDHMLERVLESKEKPPEKSERKTLATAVENEFKLYEQIQRIPKHKNLLMFREEHKHSYPLLFATAQILLAVPATQVSVERDFSALK